MKSRSLIQCAAFCAAVGISGTAYGLPWQIEIQDGPQDTLALPPDIHELGVGPAFQTIPISEEIISFWVAETPETSCFEPGSDNPVIPNQLVSITNLTQIYWQDLHYVADPETNITNFDGWIANAGAGDFEEAFRIDNVGINMPLVSESMTPDLIFEPGETWQFILQDWSHLQAPPPNSADFDSPGIAGNSGGWPPSTGSIIAVIPEPGSALLGLFGAGLLFLRRRK